MDFAPPREIGWWIDSKAGIGSIEAHSRNHVPPTVQVRHDHLNHQVRGEGLVRKVLQYELGVTALESSVASILPYLFESEVDEQAAADLVVLPARNERHQRQRAQLVHRIRPPSR